MGAGSTAFPRYREAGLLRIQELEFGSMQSLQDTLTECVQEGAQGIIYKIQEREEEARSEEKRRRQGAERPRGNLLQEGTGVPMSYKSGRF